VLVCVCVCVCVCVKEREKERERERERERVQKLRESARDLVEVEDVGRLLLVRAERLRQRLACTKLGACADRFRRRLLQKTGGEMH
jgi:hypothetical protein